MLVYAEKIVVCAEKMSVFAEKMLFAGKKCAEECSFRGSCRKSVDWIISTRKRLDRKWKTNRFSGAALNNRVARWFSF
jgi:hypothetical protein